MNFNDLLQQRHLENETLAVDCDVRPCNEAIVSWVSSEVHQQFGWNLSRPAPKSNPLTVTAFQLIAASGTPLLLCLTRSLDTLAYHTRTDVGDDSKQPHYYYTLSVFGEQRQQLCYLTSQSRQWFKLGKDYRDYSALLQQLGEKAFGVDKPSVYVNP